MKWKSQVLDGATGSFSSLIVSVVQAVFLHISTTFKPQDRYNPGDSRTKLPWRWYSNRWGPWTFAPGCSLGGPCRKKPSQHLENKEGLVQKLLDQLVGHWSNIQFRGLKVHPGSSLGYKLKLVKPVQHSRGWKTSGTRVSSAGKAILEVQFRISMCTMVITYICWGYAHYTLW